jgi:Eukaryotic membrane protein family
MMCPSESTLGTDHDLALLEPVATQHEQSGRAFPHDTSPFLQVATLQRLDAGAMYFWMKDLTQEFLKLSIIYSSVEILDKVLCCSLTRHQHTHADPISGWEPWLQDYARFESVPLT